MSEPRIETRLIRAHGIAALAMVVVSALFGTLVAAKFVAPDFLGGAAHLSPQGRRVPLS